LTKPRKLNKKTIKHKKILHQFFISSSLPDQTQKLSSTKLIPEKKSMATAVETHRPDYLRPIAKLSQTTTTPPPSDDSDPLLPHLFIFIIKH
jgi:hypothetical protein